MRRFGIYLSGSLDSSIPKFFDAHKPNVGVIQAYFNGANRFWPAARFAETGTIEKVKLFMKRHDVKVVIHAPYVFTLNQPEKTAKAVERHLAYCDGLGIEALIVHSGSWKPNLFTDPVSAWTEFLKPMDKYRATVLLENMPYREGAMTAKQLNQVCDAVKCGICLDTVHAWVCPSMVVDKLDPKHVKLIHLNQTKSGKGSGKDSHSENHLNDGLLEIASLRSIVNQFPHADVVSEYALEEWSKEMNLITEMMKGD